MHSELPWHNDLSKLMTADQMQALEDRGISPYAVLHRFKFPWIYNEDIAVPPDAYVEYRSSRFPGIFWAKENQKWTAAFKRRGKTHWVGAFDDDEEAAIALAHAIAKWEREDATA